MSEKQKILIAMSGGIDSSMAAYLLQKQGFDIVGVTLKVWDYASSGSCKKETGCCNIDTINDARIVAQEMGFPHYVMDVREIFAQQIISNFIDEYLKGRTPNPCVLCNTHIKWGELLNIAKQLGCQKIATGHYATINQLDGRFFISQGTDDIKDQSYVLWGLTQEQLSKTVFPLSNYSKQQVKQMAIDAGFEFLSKKSESFDICFIPDNDYRKFLQNNAAERVSKIGEGNFVDINGKFLGKHKGYPYYTIGQRKGLEIALGTPHYVKEIHAETNTVVLAEKKDIVGKAMKISQYNLMKYEQLPNPYVALVKVRYKDAGTMADLMQENDYIRVDFHQPVAAIAPGQSAVIMEGNDLVGGGFINLLT